MPRASRAERLALGFVVLVAAGVRAWGLSSGPPYAAGIDEPAILDKSVRMLQSGDLDPHVFDYPTGLICLQAIVAAARDGWGSVMGQGDGWAGVDVAADRAVLPVHVRESHFVLTDQPATTSVTLALWWSVRGALRADARVTSPGGGNGGRRGVPGDGALHRHRLAGLAHAGVHLMGHAFCSHLAMKGAPARAVQELSGHADLSTT